MGRLAQSRRHGAESVSVTTAMALGQDDGGRAAPGTERMTRNLAAPGTGRTMTPHGGDCGAKAVLGEGSGGGRRRRRAATAVQRHQ
jgi:hypothetical protein